MAGTTKHFVSAARLEQRWAAGKFDMFGNKRPAPSQDYLDRVATEKLTGGYKVTKGNLCPSCFTYKSSNGSCNC